MNEEQLEMLEAYERAFNLSQEQVTYLQGLYLREYPDRYIEALAKGHQPPAQMKAYEELPLTDDLLYLISIGSSVEHTMLILDGIEKGNDIRWLKQHKYEHLSDNRKNVLADLFHRQSMETLQWLEPYIQTASAYQLELVQLLAEREIPREYLRAYCEMEKQDAITGDIAYGILRGVPCDLLQECAESELSHFQIMQIVNGYTQGLSKEEVRIYLDKEISPDCMNIAKTALLQGVDKETVLCQLSNGQEAISLEDSLHSAKQDEQKKHWQEFTENKRKHLQKGVER